MEILNVKIKNVTDVTRNNSGELYIGLIFSTDTGGFYWSFNLLNPVDVMRFNELMWYTGANKKRKLNGKNVRIILDKTNAMQAFGHSVNDSFVSIKTKKFIKATESKFRKMLK
ncbi:MAG: hypothetical protein K2H53_01795 [Clostridia bacterium]|nr:hypothetical protein [Clostridia bacterium]